MVYLIRYRLNGRIWPCWGTSCSSYEAARREAEAVKELHGDQAQTIAIIAVMP